MLSLEILLAFAIVFAIAAFGLRSWQLYRMPLGFAVQDVWSVSIGTGGKDRLDGASIDAFLRGVRELPEVAQASFASITPYTHSTHIDGMKAPGGPEIPANLMEASDDFAAVMSVPLAEGRWFAPGDNGAAARPVVINRMLAERLFPGQAALGRAYASDNDLEHFKVVGIVDDYRGKGELMAPVPFMIKRFVPTDVSSYARSLLLRVKPGTDRAFESRLNSRLKAIRNDWSYSIRPLPDLRKSELNAGFTPLIILATIAAFMLVMVAFGLFGALWQNTTQRIPEIGLRRALGARAGAIYGQIIAEQLLLSSVAIALGLVLLVQLPLTGALGAALNWQVFFGAAGLSMTVIYLLSLLCSLYPGWRASRLSPTQALHHE
ncbi:ABC transporter permease [Massilia sp. S19_KUP03_FR1]|uniref:ABC transporter permease n=1 Tax=Massilia sp. S19_KUP03_FR1 TaxID=3025503 RepID=UPI002FCD2C9A